jgi:cell division initiation protein
LRITPLDIYQQEFKRVLRGFDPDEVEDFLERIADDYEQLIKENTALEEQIKSLEVQLATGPEAEQIDASEISTKEDASDIIRAAEREADSVIREAKREADSIIAKAKDEARDIRRELGETSDEAFRKQMDLLLEEARTKAKQLMEEARTEEMDLRREISKLRGKKERFLMEYRELLEKHLRILTERL